MNYRFAVVNAIVFIGLVFLVTKSPSTASLLSAPEPQRAPVKADSINAGSIAGVEDLGSGSFVGVEVGKREHVADLTSKAADKAIKPPGSSNRKDAEDSSPGAPQPQAGGEPADGKAAGGQIASDVIEFNTYAADNNVVEIQLPTVAPQTVVVRSAELGGTPIDLPAEAAKLDLAIGILTAPALLYSRLVPLLETSLRHEKHLYVFFEQNKKTQKGQKALTAYLTAVGRVSDVTIVQLPPLDNMLMSIRNAWVDIPGFLAMKDLLPTQEFFAIVDDDTYFLMNGIRLILHETIANATLRAGPIYMGSSIGFGEKHGWRVIRNPRTGTRSILPSTRRTPITYVVGGSGIIVNRHALDRVGQFKEACLSKHLEPAGDIRLGYCMHEADVPIHRRLEMVRVSWFQAIGEFNIPAKRRFPASFHGVRRRDWFYAMRAVEESRSSSQLVTWEDLKLNFPIGPKYYDALFHPSSYSNYSAILGLSTRSPSQMTRYLKRKKILDRMGFKEKKEVEYEF